jgi:chromosomal replication initiation ATPase DnaA
MMTIAEGVMESSGFNLEDLRSRRRANVLVHVRHAVARAIVDAGFSYASTGRFLNRDHAAIIYALKGDARKRGAHR